MKNILLEIFSSQIVCSDNEVNLFDIRIGNAIQKLPEVNCELKEVQWNPAHQSQLIVGSRGGHLIEWDIRSTLDYITYGVDEVRLSRRPAVTRGRGYECKKKMENTSTYFMVYVYIHRHTH